MTLELHFDGEIVAIREKNSWTLRRPTPVQMSHHFAQITISDEDFQVMALAMGYRLPPRRPNPRTPSPADFNPPRAITRDEILAKQSGNGGWKYEQLREWGVPTPPPKGWIETLVRGPVHG